MQAPRIVNKKALLALACMLLAPLAAFAQALVDVPSGPSSSGRTCA